MGGAVVLQYTLDYPDQVTSLILVGPEGVPGEGGYDPDGIYLTDEFKASLKKNKQYGPDDLTWQDHLRMKISLPWVVEDILEVMVYDTASINERRLDRSLRLPRYQGDSLCQNVNVETGIGRSVS